jgi:DedD protein
MDQMLKQRLIGAIVIISLAVIFLPMILEGPDDELSPRTQDMPPPPTIDYQSEVELAVPAASTETPEAPASAVAAQEESAQPEASAPPPEPAAAQPEPAAAQPEPAAAQPEAAVGKPESAESAESAQAPRAVGQHEVPPQTASRTAADAAVPGDAWMIQVGSFEQHTNATSLRDRLKRLGYRVSVQDAKSANRQTYRVLVGPENDRAAADRLRDKLAREHQLRGIVLQDK